MRWAYDTCLELKVKAESAAGQRDAQSGEPERHRYCCPRCYEEVCVAAAGSGKRVPHFRHRHGNGGVSCDKYIGKDGTKDAVSSLLRGKNKRAEFYFDGKKKTFCLRLCLDRDEIEALAADKVAFELHGADKKPLWTLKINADSFAPDTPVWAPIDRFSERYCLSVKPNGVKREHLFFRRCEKGGFAPLFFRMPAEDGNPRARWVQGADLYTGVLYYILFPCQEPPAEGPSWPEELSLEGGFAFEAMGKTFWGGTLTVRERSVRAENLLNEWGYRLGISETLTLLWPPVVQAGEVSKAYSNRVFLFSSFSLVPGGNINLREDQVAAVGEGVWRVLVDARAKIYRKNAEIVIIRDVQPPCCFDALVAEVSEHAVYTAGTLPDGGAFFLFNRSGVTPLSPGQSVFLTPGSRIRRYRFGYADLVVKLPPRAELSGKQLLLDILAHYRREEPFTPGSFEAVGLSETASAYVRACRESGLINVAAKRFIEEGLL